MKRRILIVGGGPAAISTAFHLTSRPGWQDELEITVVQQGWRLGGKGASGRDLARGARIEEHGLHVWGGFYENSFAMMRACFDELHRPETCPIRSVEQGFVAQSHVAWGEVVGGEHRVWRLDFPENPQRPGDGAPVATSRQILARLAGWTAALLRQLPRQERENWRRRVRGERSDAPWWEEHDLLRRTRVTLDLVAGVWRGILADRVMSAGFASLDDLDLRDWLRRHGVAEASLDAAPLRAFYDYFFAYEDGDTARPRMAAGMGLHHMLRLLLAYKGALFWKMTAGMGDVVFAPLFELLSRRGVRFRFFHRLEDITLDDRGERVVALRFARQAATVDGAPYRPLVDVGGLPCWPSTPRWEQLVDEPTPPEAMENPLLEGPRRGEWIVRAPDDVDAVVLAIPPGELPRVAPDVLRKHPRWRRMLAEVRPIQTLAAQVWCRPTAAAMGWPAPATAATALPHPFETWADMSQTLASEAWAPGERPAYVAYFCGPMPTPSLPSGVDPDFVDAQHAAAESAAGAWFAAHLPRLLPGARDASGWRAGSIVDRYVRSNVAPSERYVVTLPGAPRFQLTPEGSGLRNLALAGDWLNTGLGGSVEGAVLSGIQASRALTGWPTRAPGELEHNPYRPPRTVDRITS